MFKPGDRVVLVNDRGTYSRRHGDRGRVLRYNKYRNLEIQWDDGAYSAPGYDPSRFELVTEEESVLDTQVRAYIRSELPCSR